MYYCTTEEIADLFRVSKVTILRWIQSGKLPGVRVRQSKLQYMQIAEEDLKAFIESHTFQRKRS